MKTRGVALGWVAEILFLLSYILSIISNPATLVQQCIEGLKKGKAAGVDGLMAEHICFAHPIVSVHLTLYLRCYMNTFIHQNGGLTLIPTCGNRIIVCTQSSSKHLTRYTD